MAPQRLFTIITVLGAAALAACGGGSGSAPTAVTSVGVISGFGSVIVNGVDYNTENSRVVSADDGSLIIDHPTNAQLRQHLGLGQVVTVRGSSAGGTGVADSISVDNELVGPIESISSAERFIVVLGQIVTVTPDTIIDDSIIEAARGVEIANDLRFGDLTETLDDLLAVDMVVEISGFPTANGLEATRIEDVNNRDRIAVDNRGVGEVEIKGFVRNLTGTQFVINGLTVTYDASDLDDDFGGGGLVEGQFVEVKGAFVSSTLIDATRIELEDDNFEAGRIEIEGIVQEIRPDSEGVGGVIIINGFEIRVNDVSQFMVGLRVELKGRLQSDGTVVLSRIEDESEDTVRTADLVVSGDGTSFTTRLGLTVMAATRTRLEIKDGGSFAGKQIEARGFPNNGGVLWTRIEIGANGDQGCRLRGPATNITGTAADFTFAIEGVTINVGQVSDNNFEGANDQPIGRQAFFDQLADGNVVQAAANGSGCTAGTLIAREVEFENED